MAPTKDELRAHVADTAKQCSDQVRFALERDKPSDAADYARALESATAAHRDLEDED